MPITIAAPAKVNLVLEVLSRRRDGYHEIRSIVQAVRLCDYLLFESAPDLSYSCDQPDWKADKSLVSQAVLALRELCGIKDGVHIVVIKHVPLSAGLGGDSSCAAATLEGLNRLWQLGLSAVGLEQIAAGLGSDVPFFLGGGTALARGKGEIISPLPEPARMWLVLLVPDLHVPDGKTGSMYARLTAQDFTSGARCETLAVRLKQGKVLTDDDLYNVFEGVASGAFLGLERFRAELLAAGAAKVHVAGAGPTLFSLHRSRDDADAVLSKLKGYRAFVVDTLAEGETC